MSYYTLFGEKCIHIYIFLFVVFSASIIDRVSSFSLPPFSGPPPLIVDSLVSSFVVPFLWQCMLRVRYMLQSKMSNPSIFVARLPFSSYRWLCFLGCIFFQYSVSSHIYCSDRTEEYESSDPARID